MRDEPVVIRVQAFSELMREDADALDESWASFYANLDAPVRLITRTRRFDLREPQRRLDTLERGIRAGQVPAWRLNWIREYRQMYATLNTLVALRGVEHDMLIWPGDGVRPDALAAIISQTFDTSGQVTDLAPLLPGAYHEEALWLAPDDPQHPYVTFLTAYTLRGVWTTAVLHRVLSLDLDLAICVDAVPVARTQAQYTLDLVLSNRKNQLEDGRMARDVHAERQYRDALAIQDLLADGQQLHDLRVVLAVFGSDPDDLSQAVRSLDAALGARAELMRPPGGQAPLARFFTGTPTLLAGALTRPLRRPSQGVAVMTMFGMRKPASTEGILYGLQGDTPILFDAFADRRPAHAVVVGKTGSGKTVALNTIAMRFLVEQGGQVVLYEPQGHSRRLIQATGKGGVRAVLDPRQQINVLDVVVGRGDAGEPPSLAAQIEHVVTQLSVLLGQQRPSADGRMHFAPRLWSDSEIGILHLALQSLYEGVNLETLTSEQTPIMLDLCTVLAELGTTLDAELAESLAIVTGRIGGDRRRPLQTPGGVALALQQELIIRLVRGPQAAIFNARTSIDWNFTHDATAYDFSQIPDGPLRVFYYGQAFGALNRYVRSPQRNRRRPLLAMIDEFAYMAKVPSLARFAADAAKTWRTFGAAIWTADQDAHTYLGTENGVPDESMLSIFLNAPIKIIFRQDAADARRLKDKIQGLRDAHVQAIMRLNRGRCVLVWDGGDDSARHNEVFVVDVELTSAEARAFLGS